MDQLTKLESFRKSLAIAETIEEIKLIGDAANAFAILAKKQNISYDKQNEIGDFRLEIEERKAEWLDKFFPHGSPAGESGKLRGNKNEPRKMPVSKKESATAKKIKKADKETKEKAKQNIKAKKKVVTPEAVAAELKAIEKEKQLQKNKSDFIESIKKTINAENRPIIINAGYSDYLSTIKDTSVDLLFTDPPYLTDVSDIHSFAIDWLSLALRKVKDNGRAFICIGAYPEELHCYLDILLKYPRFHVDNPIIWTYKNTLGVTPKMKYNLNYQIILHLYSDISRPLDTSVTNEMFNVMDINAPDGRQGDRLHTWQKPDELALRLIKHGTKQGDTILDCFACTGTFLLAAAKLDRVGIGCDISAENLEIAKQRGCIIK